jgi:hypothetical protein
MGSSSMATRDAAGSTVRLHSTQKRSRACRQDERSTDMSKSNVNPNHYKVAGRGRQGEDIAQARNKQKLAENDARRRTEIGARSQKPAPMRGAASPDSAPTRVAKTATREARATPPQAPPARKRGRNLLAGGSGPHARFSRPPAVLRPTGAAPQPPARAKQAKKKVDVKLQGLDKRSKRSTARKRASFRHEFDPMPGTNHAVGSFGKRTSPRLLPMRK